jgi:succinate dehydrogenase/fumarate reductase flavoprotein subunit
LNLDGAVGFSVRDPEIYVFKAGAAVCTCGGATNIRRPHAVGEGGFFRGSHAFGPCVDNNWLKLG